MFIAGGEQTGEGQTNTVMIQAAKLPGKTCQSTGKLQEATAHEAPGASRVDISKQLQFLHHHVTPARHRAVLHCGQVCIAHRAYHPMGGGNPKHLGAQAGQICRPDC